MRVYSNEHEVVFGEGDQTIAVVPMHPRGFPERPSSAVYKIERLDLSTDDSERDVQAEAAATIDSVSTTTSAAAGPTAADPRKLSLASASGVTAGTPYIVSGPGGQELAVVNSIDSSDVYAQTPLGRTYASGATFKGILVSGTFPSAHANDLKSGRWYRVTWEWTFGDGTKDVRRQLVRVVRTSRSLFVTPEEIAEKAARLVTRVRTDEVEKAIRAAHRDYWREIRGAGQNPDDWYHGEFGGNAVAWRAIWYLRQWAPGEDDERLLDLAGDEWREGLSNLKNGRTGDGAAKVPSGDDTAPDGPDQTVVSKFRKT